MADLDPDQLTASQIIRNQLSSWGLDALSDTVNDLIREGLGTDAITLRLQETDQYKQRFKANEARRKAGLAVLTPAEYVATENAYRQVLQSYGLPATFYDQQSDFEDFLAKDLSPDEIKSRASVAQSTWLSADEGTKAAWRDFYGLSDGAAIAAILDPDRALPTLQSMAATAKAGGVAKANGLEANEGRIRSLVDSGYTADQLAQGFNEIGSTRDAESAMAARFGTAFSQADAEDSRIRGLASAQRKQQSLYESEKALFDSRAGADKASLNRRTSGSY